jgi:hypothetical protein
MGFLILASFKEQWKALNNFSPLQVFAPATNGSGLLYLLVKNTNKGCNRVFDLVLSRYMEIMHKKISCGIKWPAYYSGQEIVDYNRKKAALLNITTIYILAA